jgi:CDP-diacylglycerol--serine O-phosphatidyltransferase
MVLLLSWLMVSNIRMMTLKFPDFSLKNNMPKIILLVIAIIASALLHWAAVPVIFLSYIIISITTVKIKTE